MNRIKIIFALLLMMVLAGCGFWGNFTTYFNRYFNAKKAFEEAMEIIEAQPKELFAYKEERIPNNANSQLDKVVEKCSNILQFNAESGYVSDALYMTGVSFYYQQNYSKALRKFNELAARNDEDFLLENKLWTGKTNIKLRDFEVGFEILDSVKAQALVANEERFAVDAYVAQISYLVYRENYSQAVGYINDLLEISSSDELNAEITYELGNLYYEIDSLEAAANAYLRVDDFSPTFEIQFDSRLRFAEVKRLLGEVDQGLELLEDLRYESKFQDDRDRVELEIGLIYLEQDNLEEAMSMLMEIDSLYSKKPSAGIAAFHLGNIMVDEYADYDSALFYYDKTLANREVPQEIKSETRKKSRLLNKYITLFDQIASQELQYVYSTDVERFLQDSVDYAYLKEQERLNNPYANSNNNSANNQNQTNQDNQNQSLEDSTSVSDSTEAVSQESMFASSLEYSGRIVKIKPIRPRIETDSIRTLISKSQYEMGNLFLTEIEQYDSAFHYYDKVITEDPEGYYEARTLFALGSYYHTVEDTIKADSLFTLVYDNYPEEEVAKDAAKRLGFGGGDETDEIEQLFVEAENNYLAENYDIAIPQLFEIFEAYPNSDYAPKSLYTIGWLLENKMEMPDSAASVYDSLSVHYKRSEYTLAINRKLTEYKTEQVRLAAVQDSIALADSLARFEDIEEAVESSGSIVDSLGTNVPDSTQIPRNEIITEPAPNDSTGTQPVSTEDVETKADTIKNIPSIEGEKISETPENKSDSGDSLKLEEKKK